MGDLALSSLSSLCRIMSINHHDPCSEVLAQGDLRRASCGAGPASSNGVRGGAENTTVDLVPGANVFLAPCALVTEQGPQPYLDDASIRAIECMVGMLNNDVQHRSNHLS